MAVVVLVVGGAVGDADGEEGDGGGDEVDAGVGGLGEHAERAGEDAGEELEEGDAEGGEDGGERGGALGVAAVLLVVRSCGVVIALRMALVHGHAGTEDTACADARSGFACALVEAGGAEDVAVPGRRR